MPELSVEVIVRATPQQVWDVVFDWPRQGEWILGTSVAVRHGDGRSVGSEVGAYTGRPPLGFLDTFVITDWSEPHRCEVVHTGTVVRGTGIFECRPLPAARTRFVWTESLDLPWGRLGAMGWPLARPVFRRGVQHSLTKLAELVEREVESA